MEQALISQERTPYQLMDALDDELIKAELENRIVDTWVYSFSSDGRPQTGLSKIGVDACCTEMAKKGNVIRESEIRFDKDPTNSEYVLFQGMATRYIIIEAGKEIEMETVNGTKRQWTKMKLRNMKIVDDPFWYEKGAMKALRNARSRLIPEEIRTKVIALAKKKGKVKPVKEPKSKNEEKKTQNFEFLDIMKDMKKALGNSIYYEILGHHGYAKAIEIIDRKEQEKVYIAMKEKEGESSLDQQDIPYS